MFTRRSILKVAAALGIGDGSIQAQSSVDKGKSPDPEPTAGGIELYTSALSAGAGDSVTIHVSTGAKRFNLLIMRVGLEEQVVWTKESMQGHQRQTPADAWENGCRWPASARVRIPENWKSG